MNESLLSAAALAGLAALLPMAQRRVELSLAKHPSLTGHSRMAKRVANGGRTWCGSQALITAGGTTFNPPGKPTVAEEYLHCSFICVNKVWPCRGWAPGAWCSA